MNYYFLLEDEKSFIKVFPLWLEHMGIEWRRVADIKDIEENTYVLQSGQGVTRLVTKILFDTIDTIMENPGKIDKLVVILDAEEISVEEREQQVYEKIKEKYNLEELSFEIVVFVCNHCFETWLLGSENIYPSEEVDENSFFYPYYKHYNINTLDPENMPVPNCIDETIAQYHFHYLHELFRYKKIRYTKKRPTYVTTKSYFEGIVKRVKNTGHVKTFQKFVEFLKSKEEQKYSTYCF